MLAASLLQPSDAARHPSDFHAKLLRACAMQSVKANEEHVLLVDAPDLSSAAAGGIYRQLQLVPDTWRVKEGTAPLAPELLPSSDALTQGLLLLNKTIRVWLDGARAKPTLAPVVVSTRVM